MERAYALCEFKSVDDEQRIMTGIATTPSVDREGDIVESTGAAYKLPIPFLWQHDSTQPIGLVTAAKVAKTGITVTVQLAKTDEPGTLKNRLDEAWQTIKLGLVRGMSIGFMPTDSEQIENSWGRRFLSWDWLELSAVTIPANMGASIQTLKSIDHRILRALPGAKQGPTSVELLQTVPAAVGEAKAARERGYVQLIPRKYQS